MSFLEPEKEELERRAKLVADELNGMQPHTQIFYQLSIRYSVERCLEVGRKKWTPNRNLFK